MISIYEEDNIDSILTETEVPIYGSGKIGTYYPDQNGSAAYEITDHLGNVRALVRDNVSVYTATMEDNGTAQIDNPRVEEMLYFENLFETEVTDSRMNHTKLGGVVSPDKAAYLYWVDGMNGTEAADKAVGPAIALKVNAGDKLDIETWARYERKVSYTKNFSMATLASFLGGSFAYTGGFEGSTLSQATQNLSSALTAAAYPDDGSDDTRPFAYLNYIVYDKDMVYKNAGWLRVTDDGAGFNPGEEALQDDHEHLKLNTVSIGEDGFIYVWVSNQSEATKVWFDDLTVTHTGTILTQATDYGVWGDILREQKTDLSTYRFGYQGQFSEKDEETGWNHFELREYDPVIGRWLVPDPAGQYASPYLAFGNNPVSRVDPDGGTDGDPGDDVINTPFSVGFSSWRNQQRQVCECNNPSSESAGHMTGRLAKHFGYGMLGGLESTWEGIKYNFTWQGMLENTNISQKIINTGIGLWNAGSDIVENIPNYTSNDWAYGGGFVTEKVVEIWFARQATVALRGGAALGSGFGPFKQWIRFHDTYSKVGKFGTYGMKWGASPIGGGKYIKQIGSPYWQRVNQKFRNWKIPVDSWRTADPGHLHFWKR